MTRALAPACALLLLACEPAADFAADDLETTARCDQAAVVATLPRELVEASGVAASRIRADVLWVHNDSEGTPALYAIDTRARLIGEVRVPVTEQADWEDIAAGPCPAGSCLYIGDIGDNLQSRRDRAILRVPEPAPDAAESAAVERFPIRFPVGPQDAEALFVLPDTSVWIVTKGRDRPVTLYRYPPPLRPNDTVTLVPVQTLGHDDVQLGDMVTGADASPDGDVIAVRTYTSLQLYRFDGDTLAPLWPGRGLDLTPLAEPQGEGVAFHPDGSFYLVSETGPFALPPPLSRLHCTLPP